jgi:hypothetical protein
MRTIVLTLLAAAIVLIGQEVSFAQNLFADYVRNVPRHYGPRDPWDVGLVLRHQAGWGGHFYNCDCEEHKRMSPYIRWEQQPTVCCPHGHCWWIKQQINEVHQRIRTGACLQSQFCICPQCCSSAPPITPTCPDEIGVNGCPTCRSLQETQDDAISVSIPTSEPASTAQAAAPSNSANPNEWLGRLYQAK